MKLGTGCERLQHGFSFFFLNYGAVERCRHCFVGQQVGEKLGTAVGMNANGRAVDFEFVGVAFSS